MNTSYFDPAMTDDQRRAALYDGQLLAFQSRPSVLALVGHARPAFLRA